MLPKRKYIRSYIGMGVALPIYGQTQAVKLKIIGMLVSYDCQGAFIEGLRLANIVLYKDVLVYDCTFERNGMTYVDPKTVFRCKREAIEYIDEIAKSEIERKMSAFDNEVKKLEDQLNYMKSEKQAYEKKIDKVIKTIQSRKWNKSL